MANQTDLEFEFQQNELDRKYSPSRWSKRLPLDKIADHHVQMGEDAFKKAKSMSDYELDVEYTDDNVCLDIFKPKDVSPDAPVCLYIHGGYWQKACVKDGTHFATPLLKNGVILVCVKYTVAPKGTLQEMVIQIRQSVVFIANKYPKSRGIYLCGHSAGAHLAAMCLPVDWTVFNVKQDIIKGMLLVSGIFDVTPLIHTYVNVLLKMTEVEAKSVSPFTYIEQSCKLSKHCKIIVALAEQDPPSFLQQSTKFAQQLNDGGVSTQFIRVPGKDHFDIIHSASQDDYILIQELLKLIEKTSVDTTDRE